jgi:hypothetical protein
LAERRPQKINVAPFSVSGDDARAGAKRVQVWFLPSRDECVREPALFLGRPSGYGVGEYFRTLAQYQPRAMASRVW